MKRSPLRRSSGIAKASVPVPRTKKCKACKQPFLAMRPLQSACSPACALELAGKTRAKQERAADKAKREKLKTRSDWQKEAQAAFNRYIRFRDTALPCISCLRHHDGQWHAGHYRSTGAAPHLRFDESNVHKQCQPCNTHLHGNLIAYRVNLIAKVGLAEVERLENATTGPKPTVEYLQWVRDTYRAKARELAKRESR